MKTHLSRYSSWLKTITILFVALSFNQNAFAQDIIISEFMASNDVTIADNAGDFDDWIELHNTTDQTINLNGRYLTDDPDELDKWPLPNINLAAGDYLLIWADNEENEGSLHTNFKLSAGGEYLALVRNNGTVVEFAYSPEYPNQFSDVSYGIDGDGDEGFFSNPTPDAPNTGDAGDCFIEDTSFLYERGVYDQAFNELVSATGVVGSGAQPQIIYTTDGSEPSLSNGNQLPSPASISINKTTVLRAMAYIPGCVASNIDTQTYIFKQKTITQSNADFPNYPIDFYDIGSGSTTAPQDYNMDQSIANSGAYANDLEQGLDFPTMVVSTAKENIFGNSGFYDDASNTIQSCAAVEVIYPKDPDRNHQMRANIKGHSHLRLKRSARLLFNGGCADSKGETDLLASAGQTEGVADKFDKLVLRAGNNRSWARNWNPDETSYVVDEAIRRSQCEMSGHCARGAFVHLYFNGIYFGLYNVTERPDEDFLATYFGGDDSDYFAINHNGPIDGDSSIWNSLMSLVLADNLSQTSAYNQFKTLIDVESFIDYIVLNFWVGIGDWPSNNWFAGNRAASSPLGAGPVIFTNWDAEWSLYVPFPFTGSSSTGKGASVNYSMESWDNPSSSAPKIANIFNAAKKNDEFMRLFGDRVNKHAAQYGELSDAKFLSRYNFLANQVRNPVVAESARWGDGIQDGVTRERNVHWQDEVNLVNNYITNGHPSVPAPEPGNSRQLIYQLRQHGYYPSIDAPTISPGNIEKIYGPIEITISKPLPIPSNTEIHYTLDGSDPINGAQVHPWANKKLTINQTTTIKARLRHNGGEYSALTEVTLTMGTSPAIAYGSGINPDESLILLAGEPAPGKKLIFQLDNTASGLPASIGPVESILALSWEAFLPGLPIAGYGLVPGVTYGELLINLVHSSAHLLSGDSWQLGDPVLIEVDIPNEPGFGNGVLESTDTWVYFQGALVDQVVWGVGLTNALGVRFP